MSPDTFQPCSEAFWWPRQCSCSDMTTVTSGQCCHGHCPWPRVSSIGAGVGTTGYWLPEFWWSCDWDGLHAATRLQTEDTSPAHCAGTRGNLTDLEWHICMYTNTGTLHRYSTVVLFSVYIASGRCGLGSGRLQISENFCHLNSHFISPTAFMNNKQRWLIDIHWII